MTDGLVERIKEIKKQKSITNEELAKMTGISLSTLSKLLSGYRGDFKFGTIKVIAEALDTSLDYLAYGEEASPTKAVSPREEELITDFRKLSKENQVRVKDIKTLLIAMMNS